MGILDFLFEDNHRRPPRKRTERISAQDTKIGTDKRTEPATGIKKTVKSSDFHKEKKELRIHDFRAKSVRAINTPPATDSVSSSLEAPAQPKNAEIKELKKNISAGNISRPQPEPAPAADPDLTFIRNKKLHALIQNLLPKIEEALGDNYRGTLAFDTLSEASVSDRMPPVQAYESHMKKAVLLFNGHHMGKPADALINTKEDIIYMFIKDRFIFNIFVSRKDISEGILLHSLSRVLNETN